MLNILVNKISEEILAKVEKTKSTLCEHYFADSRPWVVTYSGGKDSTVTLQLTYEMVMELGDQAKKPVFILSSDTLVEPPRIQKHLHGTLNAISESIKKHNLNMSCQIVFPKDEESFWAKLIGKGYPPPTRNFRWCTSNMKIKPARRFIEKLTAEYGSVVLLLGTRVSESSARKRRMNGRSVNSRGLNPHHEIPNTFVMTPIADWELEDIWEYLIDGPVPPWGGNHVELAELYKDATGGECPLILDITTPSCGGSRFGCWTCTVVKQDRSLQGFIDSGDSSMIPLIEYCNWLRVVREDSGRRFKFRRNGSPGPGPFDANTRKKALVKLLQTEQTLGYELISDNIIKHIQTIWSREIDLEYSAYAIANSFGRNIEGRSFAMSLKDNQKKLLQESAKQAGVSTQLVENLHNLIEEFPDLAKWGSKKQLKERIRDIITAAAGERE